MAHLCEMNQIGHVASVKSLGKNLIVRIASNANYKNGERAWVDRTHWNEHTIFERQAGLLKWASESLKPGDLVYLRSTAFQTEWEKDGETRYGQTFAVNELTLLDREVGQEGEAGGNREVARRTQPLRRPLEGAFGGPLTNRPMPCARYCNQSGLTSAGRAPQITQRNRARSEGTSVAPERLDTSTRAL